MSSINNLTENIQRVSNLIDSYSVLLQEKPNDLALSLSIGGLENQLRDLQFRLQKENEDRFKEVIELRLIGNSARSGSIPLMMLGEITSPFGSAIINASKFIQYGTDKGKAIDNVVKSTIDLRLEGVGIGSTILYISGKTSPDLFGNSLLQTSIKESYNFLESQTPEELFNKIPTIGIKSVKNFATFFKTLAKEDLELDLGWESPLDRRFEWKADHNRITGLYQTLNKITVADPELKHFRGEIIAMSSRGKIEIFTFDNERIVASFPLELIAKVKSLHLGDKCKGSLLKSTYYNESTGMEKSDFTLNDIEIED